MGRKNQTPAAFAAKYRDNPEAIAKYLNDAFSTNDPVLIIRAIGLMVRAQGVMRFSQIAAMRRDNLYRTFSGELRPAFDTVLKVLTALDIHLMAKPSQQLVKLIPSKSVPGARLKAARAPVSARAKHKAKGK